MKLDYVMIEKRSGVAIVRFDREARGRGHVGQ